MGRFCYSFLFFFHFHDSHKSHSQRGRSMALEWNFINFMSFHILWCHIKTDSTIANETKSKSCKMFKRVFSLYATGTWFNGTIFWMTAIDQNQTFQVKWKICFEIKFLFFKRFLILKRHKILIDHTAFKIISKNINESLTLKCNKNERWQYERTHPIGTYSNSFSMCV